MLLFFVAYNLYLRFSFEATDMVYLLVHFYAEYMVVFNALFFVAGWTLITYLFFQRPLRYLDEVVEASERLAKPDDTAIILSGDMKSVQDELNLLREQALHSAAAAREAEQRKNDLVVYLAHDLKTPLTSVIGYLSLLRDEPGLPQALRMKYTGIALDKAERLEALINEFFDITRFNLTRLVLEPETINLSRMLEQLTFEFQPVLAEKALRFELRLKDEVLVVCDAGKLERVFDNLIRNAVNYSYPNTAILISLASSDGTVTIRVENHGRTIPSEKLERLFEQFYRLDAARGSSSGGAGLGLAIAKEIVVRHGGTMTAESADEQIAFSVTLPGDCQKVV